MLARIGQDAEFVVSAVNLVEQLNQLAFALLGSVSLGATVIVSQYIGAGRIQDAKTTAQQSVALGFALALAVMAVFLLFGEHIFILFLGRDKTAGVTFEYAMIYMRLSVLSYPLLNIGTTAAGVIRGTGDAKSPMRISIVIGIINAVVAAVFIYGFGMSVAGAGIAMLVSRFFGAVVAVRLLVKKGFIEKFTNLLKPQILYIKQIMRIGIYQSIESLVFQFGRTITYRFFTGTVDIAANSVVGSIFNIVCAPGNSMSIVAMALIGRLTGAGDKKQSYKVLRNIILLSMAMLLLTHILFLPVFPFLITLYTGKFDPANLVQIRQIIYRLVIMNSVAMPIFWPSAFIMFAGMKGAGDVRYTSAVTIISMWSVRVLFAYILGSVFGMGVTGVWLGMFSDWIVRGLFAQIRFRSRKID
jgi:putative MATE family efflux protein